MSPQDRLLDALDVDALLDGVRFDGLGLRRVRVHDTALDGQLLEYLPGHRPVLVDLDRDLDVVVGALVARLEHLVVEHLVVDIDGRDVAVVDLARDEFGVDDALLDDGAVDDLALDGGLLDDGLLDNRRLGYRRRDRLARHQPVFDVFGVQPTHHLVSFGDVEGPRVAAPADHDHLVFVEFPVEVVPRHLFVVLPSIRFGRSSTVCSPPRSRLTGVAS